jgi:hypothetical protein
MHMLESTAHSMFSLEIHSGTIHTPSSRFHAVWYIVVMCFCKDKAQSVSFGAFRTLDAHRK